MTQAAIPTPSESETGDAPIGIPTSVPTGGPDASKCDPNTVLIAWSLLVVATEIRALRHAYEDSFEDEEEEAPPVATTTPATENKK